MAAFTPVQLAYVVIEPSGGEDATLSPIIFLHGLTVSKEHWDDIAPSICNATKRKGYALDARNHGDSEWWDDFSFDLNVDDLFHFMDTHSIPKGVIIGHSMGGITGLRAALRKPEKVEKLVVEDMYVKSIPTDYMEIMVSRFDQLVQDVESVPNNIDEDQAKSYIFEHFYQPILNAMKIPKKNGANSMQKAIVLKRKPDGSYAYKANMATICRALSRKGPFMSEPKGSYDGPACFIYGEISHLSVHQEHDHIKQFFPKVEFVCIKGATHVVHFDSPTEFTDAIVEFVLKK